MNPIDFHIIFFSILLKSMGSNCLVTHIILNILLCVQQKKEIHTGLGLEQLKVEEITLFSFWG